MAREGETMGFFTQTKEKNTIQLKNLNVEDKTFETFRRKYETTLLLSKKETVVLQITNGIHKKKKMLRVAMQCSSGW